MLPGLPRRMSQSPFLPCALQTALAKGERGHVPRALGFREIHAQADRLRGGERGAAGYDEKRGSLFHDHVLEGMVGSAQ